MTTQDLINKHEQCLITLKQIHGLEESVRELREELQTERGDYLRKSYEESIEEWLKEIDQLQVFYNKIKH